MEQTSNAAKFAFFYLLSLVALIFMALSTGMIIFQIINKYIVDLVREYNTVYSDTDMKFGISALIISAPIFYFTFSQIVKSLSSGELPKDSQVRKWLSYFVLLASSVVMIGWLIGTLNTFLGGELTLKFILKALTAISISAAIFSFFYYDIKRKEVEGKIDQVIKMYFFNSLIVVVAVFVVSLFVVESPAETRARKLDERIISNFYQIESEINTYYSQKKVLPKNFEELKSEHAYLTDATFMDPETKEIFKYEIVDSQKFKLCATFRADNIDENTGISRDERWPHGSGYQCLEQKVGFIDKGVYSEPMMIK